ncbi:MAG: PH domain-containing protein [Pseudoxanthomonas sp.]
MSDHDAPLAADQISAPPGGEGRVEGGEWQHLPGRGTKLAAFGGGLAVAVPATLASGVLATATHLVSPWLAGPLCGLLGAAFGAWLGAKRHRRTLWKLDEDGFALQRGRWWQTESRVPISRVQHLDLKRGPLERAFGLATLVVHTAGTRMAAVSVAGLDGDDAERLRDRLARQLDHDDAL